MSVRGTYVLLLHQEASQRIAVGALGAVEFPAGWYMYVGSAHGPGGLAARLARHRRRRKERLHWHIDYTRAHMELVEVWTSSCDARQECEWAAAASALAGASVIAPRFGASDCKCVSHLFHFDRRPLISEFQALTVADLQQEHISDDQLSRGAIMGVQELDQLVATLANPDADDEQREGAALALAQQGKRALEPLRRLAESDDADQRWWAARALAAYNAPTSVSLLIKMLRDRDPDVRACAALGLGTLAAPEGADPLTHLLGDESAYVGRIASNALIHLGTPAAPALITALGSPSSAVRAGAARALIPLESHDALPALFAALDDESAIVSLYAEEALWRLGIGMVFFRP